MLLSAQTEYLQWVYSGGGGVPKHWKASICIHTWKGTGGCIPIHPMYLDYPCTHPHRCLTQAHTPLTHHQHIPPPARVPWTHTSCNAWRSLPPALTSYGYLASHLDYQTTVSLSLLHSSLQSPNSRATCRKEQCSSRMCTRMNQTQSQGFCDILQFLLPSYQPSLQLEAWQNIHHETNHRAINHTRSLTTWARGWYQLIMLSATCWVHSWPGCSSGKDTAGLQATWEW